MWYYLLVGLFATIVTFIIVSLFVTVNRERVMFMLDFSYDLPQEDDEQAKFKISQNVKLNITLQKRERYHRMYGKELPILGVISGINVQDENNVEYSLVECYILFWENELEEVE